MTFDMFRCPGFRYAMGNKTNKNGSQMTDQRSRTGMAEWWPMQGSERVEKEFDQLIQLLQMLDKPVIGKKFTSADLQPYLNKYMTLARYPKEKPIVVCNQVLTKMILVVEGEFCLMRSSAKGGSGMIARVWGPEFLGIMQLVSDDKVFYSNIVASSNCLAVKIDCEFFLQAMRRYSVVSYACVESMSRAMTRNYSHIERLNFFTARENMLYYLHRKWTEAGENEDQPLCISEKRAVIASELGVTVRTVCRALNELKKEGLITTTSNGNIHCTPEQLTKIRELDL